MTENEIEKARYQLVVKSNDLIRNSRFSLNVVEQRIVLYLISKIEPEDRAFTEYQFKIKDFCEVCGIDPRANFTQIKDSIRNLANKSMWIKTGPHEDSLVRWIEKAKINYGTGELTLRIDEDLRGYLLGIRSNFSAYELIAILGLKSKYAIRLYELFKSWEHLEKYETSIEYLRSSLMCEKEYKRTTDFRYWVIDKSIEEINRFTDLEVEYEVNRQGRYIVGFIFTISKSEAFHDYSATKLYLKKQIPSSRVMDRELNRLLELNAQISLFDDEEEDLLEGQTDD